MQWIPIFLAYVMYSVLIIHFISQEYYEWTDFSHEKYLQNSRKEIIELPVARKKGRCFPRQLRILITSQGKCLCAIFEEAKKRVLLCALWYSILAFINFFYILAEIVENLEMDLLANTMFPIGCNWTLSIVELGKKQRWRFSCALIQFSPASLPFAVNSLRTRSLSIQLFAK